MKQPLYIHAASAISPQSSFQRDGFLRPVIHTHSRRFTAMEALYGEYISPVAIRRMSRIMKMAITVGMQALREASVTSPGAIIIGTGRGGIQDMETMVTDMVALDEGALNPTAFIQSTYNASNGWIAMMSGSDCYNQTYVHRGSAFELAMQDAQMLAAEADSAIYMLVACYDELTDNHFHIRDKQGYWKADIEDCSRLYDLATTKGSIAGEGAAAFVLSNERRESTVCITAMLIAQKKNTGVAESIRKVLSDANLMPAEISFILTGQNGDSAQEKIYEDAINIFPQDIRTGVFKHLCGEYDTSVGFGLWLAHECIRTNFIPKEVLLKETKNTDPIERIILVNTFTGAELSVFLIEKCQEKMIDQAFLKNVE